MRYYHGIADEEPANRCRECGHEVALHWDSDDVRSFIAPCRGLRWDVASGEYVDCGCEELSE